MTSKSLQFEEAGNARYTNINVGDKVLASYGHGQFVAAYVYAIEETIVHFLWGQVVFSVELQEAAENTVLIEKFNRQSVIREIMALIA